VGGGEGVRFFCGVGGDPAPPLGMSEAEGFALEKLRISSK
jgi:hypothetical protein